MNAQNALHFKNRQDAGEQLGIFLEPKYRDLSPLVIGIPRGGIEVAWYTAFQLNAELSLVVSKKLPLPSQPEYGIGAIAEEHSVYLSPEGEKLLPAKDIKQIIERQLLEVNRRIEKYRHGKPLPEMKGRVVILVDDGIATGATLVPVIRLCRKKGAAKIVIAAPVSGTWYDKNLENADDIEILFRPEDFYAVGQVYENFDQVTDQQVIEILQKEGTLNRSIK